VLAANAGTRDGGPNLPFSTLALSVGLFGKRKKAGQASGPQAPAVEGEEDGLVTGAFMLPTTEKAVMRIMLVGRNDTAFDDVRLHSTRNTLLGRCD
jgi:hypothetical protein